MSNNLKQDMIDQNYMQRTSKKFVGGRVWSFWVGSSLSSMVGEGPSFCGITLV
jgi:hypothetical protein